MEFRPCIDIHNGKVKQIVGGSLRDRGGQSQESVAAENFVSEASAAYFAELYKKENLRGGHIILLNAADSPYYEATKAQALEALAAYPGGMQVGGGIRPDNAREFLDAGASHVIVTSYVFRNGIIDYERLEKMTEAVGREHLVLDMSCRRAGDGYLVVTDRWQKVTDEAVGVKLLEHLSGYCDEFLIHAVDVEGRGEGIERELVRMLGAWGQKPVTYAGGVHSMEDLELIRTLGGNRLNVTIGSALDLFGGAMRWEDVLRFVRSKG